eukprot:8196311-Prorocentrum_lima.AAC.1
MRTRLRREQRKQQQAAACALIVELKGRLSQKAQTTPISLEPLLAATSIARSTALSSDMPAEA